MCPSEYIKVTGIAANDTEHMWLVLGSRADSAHTHLNQWKIYVNTQMLDSAFVFRKEIQVSAK